MTPRCSSLPSLQGEEASAAAPIVDYFIYGHLDEEVDRAISPCPRVLANLADGVERCFILCLLLFVEDEPIFIQMGWFNHLPVMH